MAFSVRKVYVNGNIVPYVQDSLKIDLGLGETIVRVQVSGRTVIPVVSENLETQIGDISFDIYTQDANNDSSIDSLIIAWKSNPGANIIVLEPDGAGNTLLMKNASLVNSPEIELTPNGKATLNWKGSKLTPTS